MKVKLTNIKGSWEEVANRARTTVNKGELGKEPSDKFKRKILMAEHSPIRSLIYCFKIAFLGSLSIRTNSGIPKGFKAARTGSLPTNSGIIPNF